MTSPLLRGCLGAAALALLLLFLLSRCQAEELYVTRCGHLVRVERVPEKALRIVGGDRRYIYGHAFPESGIVWLSQEGVRFDTLAHELDHVDGMEHTEGGRVTKRPECGEN